MPRHETCADRVSPDTRARCYERNGETCEAVTETLKQTYFDAFAAGDDIPAHGREEEDEYGRTEPVANYVVHVYEDRKFKRTIDRPFTPEDAEAFATEFNRTAKNYSRVALTGKNDAKPKKALD